jgi:hypothetical protein
VSAKRYRPLSIANVWEKESKIFPLYEFQKGRRVRFAAAAF